MAASTQLIADLTTVYTNGPNAATIARANAAAGYIQDYAGNTEVAIKKLQEAEVLLNTIIYDTDSTDSANLALLTAVEHAIAGLSSPSSTVLTNMATVIANGPNAATTTKANQAAGYIQDILGNENIVLTKLKETKVLLNTIIYDTDSTDSANLTLLQNIVLTLS